MLVFPLAAELQEVSLSWRARNCDESCEAKIKERLLDIDEVSEVTILPGSGQASLKWKPDAPFSYSPLNIAMRRVGPSLQQVRLVVTGEAKMDGKDVLLISAGDNTTFLLLGPTEQQEVGIAVQGTTRGRELPQSTVDRLMEASREDKPVTIKGPLFDPFRAPPYKIIIESVSVQ